MTECPRCCRSIAADPDGHLPPWCPLCGTDLRGGPAAPPAAAAAPTAEAEVAPAIPNDEPRPSVVPDDVVPPTVDHSNLRPVILVVAALCGLLCSFLVYLGVREPQLQPREPIVRDSFQVQAPSTDGWKIDEERQKKEGAALVLVGSGQSYLPAYFLVHVVRPGSEALTLQRLAAQVKLDWSAQMDGCQFVDAGTRITLAGQPAMRIAAVGNHQPNARDRPRREATVVIDQGVGYRLTREAYDRSFNAMRPAFDELIASFKPRAADEAAPSKAP